MPHSGKKNDYYRAWAKMMITIWQDKIATLNIRDTGELFKSFSLELAMQAGGDIDKIEFTYLYYGRMVDMGVRRGITMNDTGKKAKKWYNKTWYHSFKILTEKRSEMYGEEFQAIIYETLNF